jgi:hypothetical protein
MHRIQKDNRGRGCGLLNDAVSNSDYILHPVIPCHYLILWYYPSILARTEENLKTPLTGQCPSQDMD